MLGKRKRGTVVVSPSSREATQTAYGEENANTERDVYRRFFEASFAPLSNGPPPDLDMRETLNDDSSEADTEASDWSGLSESNDISPSVEMVDHTALNSKHDADELDNSYHKAFMSSKPPRQPKEQADAELLKQSTEAAHEALNLKHDLDLQRLLKESHLLEQSRIASAPGNARQRTIDLRLQELGAKTSMSGQEKMPMSHRKGIATKATQREMSRRQQARENGVILEKLVKEKTMRPKKRDRGVDVPAIGKFQSGTLKLSHRDVASIQGSGPAARKSRRKGR